MSSKGKNRKLKTAALVFLMGAGATFASAQTTPTTAPTTAPTVQTQQITTAVKDTDIKAVPAAVSKEEARLKKFLDANGGYKDKFGGYYDPKAGTYTDEKGGVIDNWGGYTYKDGSYKSKFGDYWDAPTSTFKLSNGEELKSEGTSSTDAINALRTTVEQAGGYDKDWVVKAMMDQIGKEHPLTPAKPVKPAKPK
jgi:hypothetical protein